VGTTGVCWATARLLSSKHLRAVFDFARIQNKLA
jgi:hypothetical protein